MRPRITLHQRAGWGWDGRGPTFWSPGGFIGSFLASEAGPGATVLSSWGLESPKHFMGKAAELGRGATWGLFFILDPLLQQLSSNPLFLSL